MRIAFYSPRPEHLELSLVRGGDPIFLRGVFTVLRDRGHEIQIVSHLDVRGLWSGRIPARRVISEAISVRREARRFSPDAWLIYNPSFTYPDLFGWWQRPRRYVLLSANTWSSDRVPRSWRPLLGFAHRRSLKRADRVTAIRSKNVERLRDCGAHPARVSVLHTVATASWDPLPSQSEARRHLGLPQESPIFLCATRLTEEGSGQRKTEIVLELLASLAPLPEDAVIAIVGDGPGRERIESEAARLRPQRRVVVFPRYGHAELKWFYAACDAYAFPDLLDSPRMTIVEAQACGRPVVAMRTPSAEVAVDDGRTGLLARDREEFSAALAALASDRARCESMGQAARGYVARHHSMEVRARQIEELLAGSG